MTQQRWAEIAVAAGGDVQEVVGAILSDQVGCHGWSTTANAATGYLPVDERLEESLLALRAALDALKADPPAPLSPADTMEITVRFVAEEDWANAWKQYFKPQRIGTRIVVKPTWEEFAAKPGDLIVQIDPGMAFGTGLHATTRLCLRALEEFVQPGFAVADVGTGSGILAVAAALCGASHVAATDIDPLAVRIARENVQINAVEHTVTVTEGSEPPAGVYDIVVANILAEVILEMADKLFAAVKPGGLLLASGISDFRAQSVVDGLPRAGFTIEDVRNEGDWVAVVARRP